MYIIAFGLRMVGGHAGGVLAQWMFNAKAVASAPVGQRV